MIELLSIDEIHKVLIEDYIQVKKICDKHNLKLFATGGTVLGAIRHNGFIPWDDDMDLAMPRYQYEEFIESYARELPEYIKIIIKKRNRHAAIVDTRYRINIKLSASAFVESENESPFIDLQAFDGTPNNKVHRFFHSTIVMMDRVLYKMCDPSYIHYDSWRKKWELVLIFILKRMQFLFRNPEKKMNKWEMRMKQYDYQNSEYIADYLGKYKYKDVYPKEWWEPGIMHEFENTNVLIPSKYHLYLSNVYGDYMVIPKKSEQVTHTDN